MDITLNEAQHRFEHRENGETAILQYSLHDGAMDLLHTEVPPFMGGTGVGRALAEYAFAYAKEQDLPVIVHCPFVSAYVKRHPEVQAQVRGRHP